MGKNDRPREVWVSGDAYERYVGRWSRQVAQKFILWLDMPKNCQWLDVGCGTGALSQKITELAEPAKVTGIDRSENYANLARGMVNHPAAEFRVGDAEALPVEAGLYDVAVSGLVLNFIQQPDQMIAEMARAVRKGGSVALYVWDYAGKMQFMRHFWNAAASLDDDAFDLDEGRRFPMCNPTPLTHLFQDAGLHHIETRPIDIPTDFKNFEDFWMPFLGGQGSAPGYAMSLSEERRAELRERIRNSLPYALDGSIQLMARAWAIKGIK